VTDGNRATIDVDLGRVQAQVTSRGTPTAANASLISIRSNVETSMPSMAQAAAIAMAGCG
jgi:hypothetical protein